ncbi:hypothetical protein BC834DRAFT_366159 [Gloeopeniophorella convolvens]|nr:hypothetical protein BC834DRAFT_366159 [Gloeopeniophorella convolvens]
MHRPTLTFPSWLPGVCLYASLLILNSILILFAMLVLDGVATGAPCAPRGAILTKGRQSRFSVGNGSGSLQLSVQHHHHRGVVFQDDHANLGVQRYQI